MTQTTTATARADFSIWVSTEKSLPKESTSGQQSSDRPADYLATPIQKRTESTSKNDAATLVLVSGDRPEPQQAQLALQKQSVEGSVIGLEEASIICEIQLERGLVRIALPRTFFPSDVSYGSPISISIDESSGVRRPVVTLQKLDADQLKDGNEEMAALVEGLKR